MFNEIIMSPNVILTAIQQMLEKAIDMDSGRYSDLSESILYVTRLAIRVEGYLLFLVRNKKFHSGELGNIQSGLIRLLLPLILSILTLINAL